MDENEIEERLRRLAGPDPRPETLAAIRARIRSPKAAWTVKARAAPRRLPPLAAAAAILLGAVGWYLVVSRPGAPIGRALSPDLFVTRGDREFPLAAGDALFADDRIRAIARADLALADGSSVRLDAGTALDLAEPGLEKRARLDLGAGRLFLRVAKAPGRFRVTAGAATVEVLGTVFGVARTDGGAIAGVYEGRVRVGTGAGAVELARGETARADAGAAPVRTADAPAETFAWARDWTRFENRPLGEILDWIAANSPYRFAAPDAIRAQRVSIAIAQEPMSRVVETLLLSCNLRSSIQGNDVAIQGGNP